ncbi:MAG: hypothetical protein K2O38_07055 [Muribaculaceae bacterium]|nr:hypothetical protein [Muribaculaceae bacterium]
MHEIVIPLLGFKEFHHTNNDSIEYDSSYKEYDGLDEFIGRKSILDKLQSWLKDDLKDDNVKGKKYSGAYLITGFRGMGKSSFVHKAIQNILKQSKKDKDKYDYVPISINVGNDLLTSKELLYIICKLLSAEFEKKTCIKESFRSRLNVLLLIIFFVVFAICLCVIFSNIINTGLLPFFQKMSTSVAGNKLLCIGVLCGAFLLMLANANRICYKLWRLTNSRWFITVWQIKRELQHLEERIGCETTLSNDNEFNVIAKGDNRTPGIGFRSFFGKKNVYPIANTPEIQDKLVYILGLIKRLPGAKLRFIFVIDELDKVSPEDNEKQVVPEYNSTNVVNGNSTYRSRQKALATLLANMKYFISSSEAKFIFITGYDMYEAYLADISNREFNLHSIFNGQINVSSFFRTAGNSKGADSMIEEYLCHALLNKEQQSDNRKDLLDLSNYYIKRWDNVQKLRYKHVLERRIIFLRHFLTYLFYMSNGSPKKLAIYLEKYIRSKARVEEKINKKSEPERSQDLEDITLGISDDWKNCEWFLYFDVRNIQKIEFINYIIYPMIKNLIAKSSIYNDKLLVSTSFMISNLYKFHKSGFSLRNLEYLPELLDINKTPELRDFIGGILQFLNQTHIDEAVANLYKFKFPLRLSEEITFFSKTAEETSYLFNFSHDELLSIKKLYNQQLEHYTGENYESLAVASLRHMLGDIYMLEENYEQAIFEFNEARNAIFRQVGKDQVNHSADNLLFLVRVSLKLGLAYEKRKTFDTAYVTYEHLVEQILTEVNRAEFLGNGVSVLSILRSKSSFFVNIRIVYLALLAKLSVLEKMDLGGIRENDLILIYKEFEQIYNTVTENEIRSVTIIDFFTKLGDILYFKGHVINSDLGNIAKNLSYIKLNDINSTRCKNIALTKNANVLPCFACKQYKISIEKCWQELKSLFPDELPDSDRTVEFFNILYDEKKHPAIMGKGNVFMMTMANALVGIGNTYYGCSGVNNAESLDSFFRQVTHYSFFTDDSETRIKKRLDVSHLNTFEKSLLYYLSAARTYDLLTDHKSAYNIYIQILDAISAYYLTNNKSLSNDAIDFCERLTKKAIYCTYWHYDSINCAEIDTIKHELSKKHIDQISLQYLSSYPEIEVVIYKYFGLCLKADNSIRTQVLKQVLNSRQLCRDKLVATLTQNIQNLYFKVLVNEAILSIIMPELYQSLVTEKHNLVKSLEYISTYFNNSKIDSVLESLKWHIVDDVDSESEKKFCILDYLLKDSLFCLHRITELISPLYSTTLYNNAFIGEIYEKTFYWNHILICWREMFEFTESDDKEWFISNMKERNYIYKADIASPLKACGDFLKHLKAWQNYTQKEDSRVSTIYEKVCPNTNYYLTSTYLTSNAIDFYNRSLEMHYAGKSYKEMMTTLFFLEDDLHNDSNYMNFASEMFLINADYITKRIESVNSYSLSQSHLLEIFNYVETK